MTNINNWTELMASLSNKTNGMFPKLLLRINQAIRSYQKSDENFDPNLVKKNHQEIFNNFKLVHDQLLIENDITDIFVEIPSIVSKNSIVFNMIGIGKWIKFHGGNGSRIFFFDDEKTMISDKALADFLNKIEIVTKDYKYFGAEPIVYYKFRTKPPDDVIEYIKKFNVVPLEFDQKTVTVDYPKNISEKVLLDQTIMLTLCSHLSYGFSESFYQNFSKNENKEMMVKNREDLEKYLEKKTILVNQYVYQQVEYKINFMGGPTEKQRFEELCKRITIVPDDKNPRFYYLKDIEILSVSVGEREQAIIVTSNQRLANKIDMHYQEIPYKLFYGVQLSESKYQ